MGIWWHVLFQFSSSQFWAWSLLLISIVFFCSMGSSQNENIIYGVARVDRSSRIKSQASWDVDLGAQINCSQPKKSHGSRVDRSYWEDQKFRRLEIGGFHRCASGHFNMFEIHDLNVVMWCDFEKQSLLEFGYPKMEGYSLSNIWMTCGHCYSRQHALNLFRRPHWGHQHA